MTSAQFVWVVVTLSIVLGLNVLQTFILLDMRGVMRGILARLERERAADDGGV